MKHITFDVGRLQEDSAATLLDDLREAHMALLDRFNELDFILQQPMLNKAALTTLRLELASMRLTRGSLVARLMALLINKVTKEEADILVRLQVGHHDLLRLANAHTAKWTLDATSRDWSTYKRETSELTSRWKSKAVREQTIIFPLLQRIS